jgi:hypothetical protein
MYSTGAAGSYGQLWHCNKTRDLLLLIDPHGHLARANEVFTNFLCASTHFLFSLLSSLLPSFLLFLIRDLLALGYES